MSVDLKRLQQLAEAVGWKIEEEYQHAFSEPLYRLHIDNTVKNCDGLTPIRERLEAEYRKLAEQAKYQMGVLKATDYLHNMKDYRAEHLTRIADELAVKEPTMVERLREVQRRTDRPVAKAIEVIVDALIDLYERKEK